MKNNSPRSSGLIFSKVGWLLLAFCWLLHAQAFSQAMIQGNVSSRETGETLPGVSVLMKGTSIGTSTDLNGNYQLSVPDGDAVLVFSFIGYVTQEVQVNQQSIINIALLDDVQSLDEVVVVGYGTAKKATLSGAISTVDGAALKDAPVINLGQSLAGRLAGVNVVSTSGEPGKDNTTIRIRGSNTLGNNSPLIVVDGVPGRSLERIDPNNIESMTVLKDASAAIYGSQAANGVILITTKRGKVGKPKLEFNINQGFSQPTILPKLTNAAEYAMTLNEIDLYRNREPRYTQEEIQKFADGSDPWLYPNTDWLDATLKKWSLQTIANANLSGGTESMRYYVSLGLKNQGTNYKNSNHDYRQYNFRANIDGTVNEYISVGFDIAGRMEDRNFPTGTAQLINTTDLYSVIIRQKPNMVAYWPNGLPGPDYTDGFNPVVMATDAPGYQNQKEYLFNSNIRLNVVVPWIEGLSLDGNAAIDKNFGHDKRFTKPWFLYTWDHVSYDENNEPLLVKTSRGVQDANLVEQMQDGYNILLNGLVRYEKTVANTHYINFLAGIEKRVGENKYLGGFRRYFVSTALDELDLGGTRDMTNTGGSNHEARLNYFGRINYNFEEKYLIEFLWRVDGTYIFAKSGRYGFFPGVSIAWRPSAERFWSENIGFINDFKLRASYGQTGNDRIDPYQFLTTYAFAPRNQSQVFNIDQEQVALFATRIPNQGVTWEVAHQSNIGFDASLLRDRLVFTFDYFNYLRTNILWQRSASVPKSTGFSLPRENIGEVSNRGFDFELGYTNQVGEFSYNVWLNAGYQKNKIEYWDESPGAPDYQRSTGHPMNSALYYQAIGIFKDQAAVDAYPSWPGARPGDIIFKDVNEDGTIDAQDRVRDYRSSLPTSQGGLGVDLRYKEFDFSLFLQGSAGAVRNINRATGGDFGNGLKWDFEDRWTPENINASKPRASDRDSEYWRANANTFYLYSTDYIRLKNLQIGYSPAGLNRKLGAENIRFYISGFNLLTFTSLPDFDPEDASDGSNLYYPVQRILNAGLSLTF